jgi:hypothetical protein
MGGFFYRCFREGRDVDGLQEKIIRFAILIVTFINHSVCYQIPFNLEIQARLGDWSMPAHRWGCEKNNNSCYG